MAIQSQPSRIPEPFAGSGTKNTIPATNATPSASQAASWASGFPPECSQPISAGGCPVPRDDVNGALNQITQDYAFRQDGGIWEWSALADYDASRVVRGSDGKIYYALAQSGPSVAAGAQDPTADNGTYWTAMPTDDADVVHRTGDERIYGIKKFFSSFLSVDRQPICLDNPDILSNGTVSAETDQNIFFRNIDGKHVIEIGCVVSNSIPANRLRIDIKKYGALGASSYGRFYFRHDGNGTLSFYCNEDNASYLGLSNFRWKQIYAGSSTISTSDEREKSSISSIPDDVLDAWSTVDFAQFQFKDAIAEKGEDSARLHSGLIAQRIDAAFKAAGLDASRYGLFCYDEWEADPDGDPAGPAGDRYSLRYEEALCMEAAYQRRRADRAEVRLAALEERLSALEAKLNAQP